MLRIECERLDGIERGVHRAIALSGGRDNIAVIVGHYAGSPDAKRSCTDCDGFTVIETNKSLVDTDVEITQSK